MNKIVQGDTAAAGDLREAAFVESGEMVSGEFTDIAGERFYVIRNVDRMLPFFMTVVSSDDHWLFVSSTGGLTAGRVSPESPLFPYVTVDRIHESYPHTGPKTVLRVAADGNPQRWEPFDGAQASSYAVSRHLYKSVSGDRVRFEEINHDLELAFRYTWATSAEFGFVRHCELENLSDQPVHLDVLDGLQNILPAGTPSHAQAMTSNLVDAYKWAELDEKTGLALFTLYSAISDRAEPCESLRASTAFCLGLDEHETLLSSEQLDNFRRGLAVTPESRKRGIRGSYLVTAGLELGPRDVREWLIVADTGRSQAQVVSLRMQLSATDAIAAAVSHSIRQGSENLARIVAGADAFQITAEENVTAHHCANVLFNVLRGGIFADQYNVPSADFAGTIKYFNRATYARHEKMLAKLPEKLPFEKLLSQVREQGDPQLERLCREYLPITFGRRHGDPSRPWNRFAINLKDDHGKPLLSYQGNWRDIFQNWEALTFSYPEFIENVIAKFVNASTMDGFNPYRITKEGIDWEIEDPDDPWSYIGYWGDHQIIYLQKLLELSRQFHPGRLSELLRQPTFAYANVPYRIRPLEALLEDPKSTVDYDIELAETIERRVATMGADGKLVLGSGGDVYLVNLLEKMLVPLLAKLGNLVIDGGIWLNTQRPEWNDANNALVGHGLSMVTLYYMRRYVTFLSKLLAGETESVELTAEVGQWLDETSSALANGRPLFSGSAVGAEHRFGLLEQLGRAASRYRRAVYEDESLFGNVTISVERIREMLDDALAAIDQSINTNRRKDGLYHAYNLLNVRANGAVVETLYPMLEGQVAALSAGALGPDEAVTVLDALFESSMYRADQDSFMLYPDRPLPAFLEKNRVPEEQVKSIPVLLRMLANGDERVIVRDADGCYRFDAGLTNAGCLDARLDALVDEYGAELESARDTLTALYETVFNHRAFTGRSGGMFGFEGLGCIYWHMVAKLLLATQENFFAALERDADQAVCGQLGNRYYRIREGLGFNKTPAEYGAFPMDPYSHTPGHGGAQQPGMTGQVKEEILTRFGELGLRVSDGRVNFRPALLRAREFIRGPRTFQYVDVVGNCQEIPLPPSSLAFMWCQVPIVYTLDDAGSAGITVSRTDGVDERLSGLALSAETSAELFTRRGRIRMLSIVFGKNILFEA